MTQSKKITSNNSPWNIGINKQQTADHHHLVLDNIVLDIKQINFSTTMDLVVSLHLVPKFFNHLFSCDVEK